MAEIPYASMVERDTELEKEQQRFGYDRRNQISIPQIQRVPDSLRGKDSFAQYCLPKMVSFGPIHHGSECLRKGEDYKLLWTSKFIAKYGEMTNQDIEQVARLLQERIEDNIEELKNLFSEDAILGGNFDCNDFAGMLFVDGCSLLYFMENVDIQHPETLNIRLHELIYIHRDILLLENQLPRRLLEMLSKENGDDLDNLFANYNDWGEAKRCSKVLVVAENPKPIHILDFVRSLYLSKSQDDGDEHIDEIIPSVSWHTCNIRDLKTAGIRVLPSGLPQWNNISFTSNWFSGDLRLPKFEFCDLTPFWNFVAYEMCLGVHCKYECCLFFSFMDSLIDNSEDVKELRLSGVIQNTHVRDEDLAKFFNELCIGLPTTMYEIYGKKYMVVKQKIEKHYRNKWRTGLAQVYNTHLSTPWAMFLLFLALVSLVIENVGAVV